MRLKTFVWLACLAVLAAPRTAAAQVPIHWTLAPAPNARAEAGQPITLVLTATIDEGWHLYGMNEPPGPIALTFVAAIVIGLIHDLLTPIQSLSNYRDMTPFVLAAVALLVFSRRRVISLSREEA